MITASIVLYKTDKNELDRLLLCSLSSSIDYIFLIDNSPNRNDEEYCSTYSEKIKYIYNGKNVGYGAGHNIALKKAIDQKSDYHIVLNPDIYFSEGTIEQLSKYMDKNPSVGAIMPKVTYPNGDIQYLCKMQPTPFDLIGRRFFPEKITRKHNEKYELRRSGYNQILNIPCLSGCFMFLRVSILQDVGLFDDRFFMYCEDFDFYKRIHSKYKTIYYPDVSIIHDHKKESYKSIKMMFIHIKSAIQYFNKWGWFFDKDRSKSNNQIIEYLAKMNL